MSLVVLSDWGSRVQSTTLQFQGWRVYEHKIITEAEPQLKARLLDAPFICGEQFTAADCIMGHNVMWARGYGLCREELFRQYLSRVSKRPGFISAFNDAHLFNPVLPADSDLASHITG